MAHCPELVAEYDAAAAPRSRRARGIAGASAVPAGGMAATPPPVVPAGFLLATTAELLAGAALVQLVARVFETRSTAKQVDLFSAV